MRPDAEEAAEGAFVEVTPAEVKPDQVAPSSVLRRSCTWSPVLRMKTLTAVPVRTRLTPAGETCWPAVSLGTLAVGAIRRMRSLLPFDVVSHSAPSGPS